MDSSTNTDKKSIEIKMCEENILVDIIRQICDDPTSELTPKLRCKVSQIMGDLNLHSSLHKLLTTDGRTKTVLGIMQPMSTKLTFQEQSELNDAIVKRIQIMIPRCTSELESLTKALNTKASQKQKIRELQESLEDKLNILQRQENEKVELMMEWLDHRLQSTGKYTEDCSTMLTVKTKILEMQSKLAYLEVLRHTFTETKNSINAYNEIHKDLTEDLKQTEQRIKSYRDILE